MSNEPTTRDLRVDAIRGVALLVIFSDHIYANPLRRIMPVSQGLSDMAEVFIFLSGYLNGIVSRQIVNRAAFVRQLIKGIRRCLLLYLAILLVHLLIFAMVELHVLNPEGLLGVRLFIPPASALLPDTWSVLTLKCLLANISVLALYLPLLAIVPFVPELLRRYFIGTVAVSCQIYLLVRFFPHASRYQTLGQHPCTSTHLHGNCHSC